MPDLRVLPLTLSLVLILIGLQSGPVAARAPAGSAAIRPVAGEVVRAFDRPLHPYGPGHRGVDLVAGAGDPVRVALAGHMVFSGTVAGVGWVTVDHGGGLVTTYGPLVDRRPAGHAVAAGAVIGMLDDATHLDWGARLDGVYIDPMQLLRRWRLHLVLH